MQDPQTPAALRAALQYVLTSEIPGEHKAALIEALTQALRSHDSRTIQDRAAAQAGGVWQDDETAQLAASLQGKLANSWQQADEVLMHVAGQLHRSPRDVRTKATELGLGAGVDYQQAKDRARSDEHDK